MSFVIRKPLVCALVALSVSVGYFMHNEGISAQTEKPGVVTLQDTRSPMTAPDQETRSEPDTQISMPAAPVGLKRISTSSAAAHASTATSIPTAAGTPVSSASTVMSTLTTAHVQHVVDYDADGKTDFAIVRDNGSLSDPTAQAEWWTFLSSTQAAAPVKRFGLSGDQFLAGDYDGDHKTDLAIWRGTFNGQPPAFWILRSSDSTVAIFPFGLDGDSPFVVGDYDGDGKDDIAVYRDDPNPVNHSLPAEWWFHPSSDTTPNIFKEVRVQWGTQSLDSLTPGDIPVPGDYNGDGKADFAVAKDNGNGTTSMWVLFGDGSAAPTTSRPAERWGLTSDFFVPGDYDGDGKTDYAVVRVNDAGTNLEWWVRWSSDLSVHISTWGEVNDLRYAVQGDYDGDGKTDIGIWRPSDATFYIIGSQIGAPIYKKWGNPGQPSADAPIANYNEQ